MRRREFIGIVGGAAAWPVVGRAQQAQRMRRIGILMTHIAYDQEKEARLMAFRKGLEQQGWTEGRNIDISVREALFGTDQAKSFANEFAALQTEVVVTETSAITASVRRASDTIPIVFVNVSDPTGNGLVASLARPGGNTTGVMLYEASIAGKWLALLKEIAPDMTSVALLADPTTTFDYFRRAAEAAAASISVEILPTPVKSVADIDAAFQSLGRLAHCGLLVLPSPFNGENAERLVGLAARFKIPAVYTGRYFVTAGGLVSYDTDRVDQYRLAADYVSRILNGAKPDILPVQAPTKYELVINLKTAQALGLIIPQTLLATADEVIE